jgi:hypothetical protein
LPLHSPSTLNLCLWALASIPALALALAFAITLEFTFTFAVNVVTGFYIAFFLVRSHSRLRRRIHRNR